jgi:hypothetical protein
MSVEHLGARSKSALNDGPQRLAHRPPATILSIDRSPNQVHLRPLPLPVAAISGERHVRQRGSIRRSCSSRQLHTPTRTNGIVEEQTLVRSLGPEMVLGRVMRVGASP